MNLQNLLDLWDTFSTGMQSVFGILSSTISEAITVNVDNEILQSVLDFIIDGLGIGQWTVIDFMLGVGLSLIVAISIIKWTINLN